jgi:hypothetical protein
MIEKDHPEAETAKKVKPQVSFNNEEVPVHVCHVNHQPVDKIMKLRLGNGAMFRQRSMVAARRAFLLSRPDALAFMGYLSSSRVRGLESWRGSCRLRFACTR